MDIITPRISSALEIIREIPRGSQNPGPNSDLPHYERNIAFLERDRQIQQAEDRLLKALENGDDALYDNLINPATGMPYTEAEKREALQNAINREIEDLERNRPISPAGQARLGELQGMADGMNLATYSETPDFPSGYEALFEEGERGEFLGNMVTMPDEEFAALAEQGSILEDGRQTRYFHTDAYPGDGLIVTDFVIEGASSGPLSGDNRALDTNPLSGEYGLDDSRMIIIIDRETGRSVVTVNSSSTNIPVFPDFTRDALPIVFKGEPHFDTSTNYFDINADRDRIVINYDAINGVTAPLGAVSVDGTFVLERGEDGIFRDAGSTGDTFPARAVTQYLPDGSRNNIFRDEGGTSLEAIPYAGPLAESVRKTHDNAWLSFIRGWR